MVGPVILAVYHIPRMLRARDLRHRHTFDNPCGGYPSPLAQACHLSRWIGRKARNTGER